MKLIVKEDMICPVLKKYCTDECCTVGSVCNLNDTNKLKPGDPIKTK